MNKKSKDYIWLGILGVLVGRIIERVLSQYFGKNSVCIFMAVIGSFLLCLVVSSIIKKDYIEAIKTFLIAIPSVISVIGMLLNNIYMMIAGVLFIFIVCFVIIKFVPKSK